MNDNHRKWWVLVAMCLLTVILNIDVTGVAIAIPVIAPEFQASLANMQWVINAYVLLSAMFQIFGGRLGDTYGHRNLFMIGTTLFAFASVGAGLSPNEQVLIAFRASQGLALGLAYPMTIILTFAAFPKAQQGFALSYIVATMGVSLAIGPPLGGVIVHYFGWRWIFFINIPIGFFALLLAYLYCPAQQEIQRQRIDYLGAFLLILGLFGVTLAINQVQEWGLSSWPFALCMAFGLLSLVALFFVERGQSYPIVNFELFQIRNFWINNVLRMIVQLVFIPVLFFVPLYLQNVIEFSPIFSGLMMLCLTVVIGIISPFAGKWVDCVGDRFPNFISMTLFALACLLLMFTGVGFSLWLIGVALFLVGIATAISFVSTVTGSVSVAPSEQSGVATGIIFTTAWLGCALGVALFGAILSSGSEHYLKKSSLTFTTSQQLVIQRVAKGVLPISGLEKFFSHAKVTSVKELSQFAFISGFRAGMLVLFVLSVFGMFFSLRLLPGPLKESM